MSAKSSPAPEPSNNPPAEGAPRVRRISNPRPRKPAKNAETAPAAAGYPDFSVTAPPQPQVAESQPPRADWPEPEAASAGAAGPPEHAKRKRRRKKGKGNGPHHPGATPDEESFPLGTGEPAESSASASAPAPHSPPPPAPPHPGHAPRPKTDPELLARFAWKIYLSEVSEEGVALVGDPDAKELARRCFRLAEIFIEEQGRRR